MRIIAAFLAGLALLAIATGVSAQSFALRTGGAAFAARNFHASWVVGNNIYVSGGGPTATSGAAYFNDVWRSQDNGATWTIVNNATPWGRQLGYTVVPTTGNTVLKVGGIDSASNVDGDIWQSTDAGVTWGSRLATGIIAGRAYHAAAVFPSGAKAGQMVVAGGYTSGNGAVNDVVVFTAAGNAVEASYSTAPWSVRFGHSLVANSNNVLILVGGSDFNNVAYNDVWISTNTGASWSLSTSAPGFTGRWGFGLTINSANRLVVAAGSAYAQATLFNDVWTADAANPSSWTRDASSMSFSTRIGADLVLAGSNVYLIGGQTSLNSQNTDLNDVYVYSGNTITYTTVIGASGTCSLSGGATCASTAANVGTQTPSFTCRDNNGNTVANSFCTPPAAQSCTVSNCVAYVRTVTGTCLTSTAPTGNNCFQNGQSSAGTRSITYGCQDVVTSSLVATSACANLPIQPASETCTVASQCASQFSYFQSGLGTCLTTTAPTGLACLASGQSNVGTQNVIYSCRDTSGTTVATSNCVNAGLSTPTPASQACTITSSCNTFSYAWVTGTTCLTSNGANCFIQGQSTTGTAAPVLVCRDSSNVVGSSSNCNGQVIPTQPANTVCNLNACSYSYQSIGFSDFCVGNVATSVSGAQANTGLYCLPSSGFATAGSRAPIFVCVQGGTIVPSNFCQQAGLALPFVAPATCTLLTCDPNAAYVLVGRRACVNSQTFATCYNAGQSSTGSADAIYQCSANGAAAIGRCTGAPPATSTACTLPICSRTSVLGDPEFVGFRGQKYEIHGIPGSIFNIISSPHLQYNAEFVYIGAKSHRACNATRTHPWTHPGTYLGQLGVMVGTDRVRIQAGDCETGIKSVTVNGKAMKVGQAVHFAEKQSLKFVDEFTLRFHLKEVELELTNSDNFFNQEVSMTRYGERTQQMHGLLGQTWQSKTYKDDKGRKHFIEGHPHDYLVQDDDLFGTDFVFNKFTVSADL